MNENQLKLHGMHVCYALSCAIVVGKRIEYVYVFLLFDWGWLGFIIIFWGGGGLICLHCISAKCNDSCLIFPISVLRRHVPSRKR